MDKKHLVVVGDSRKMAEVKSDSVQLVVTSPPYFNVKDYGNENIGSIENFNEYLQEMQLVFNECHRVLQNGRYICVNICDVISGEEKYPIPAHYVLMMQRAGFQYREDIIWRKPSGIGSKGGSGAGKSIEESPGAGRKPGRAGRSRPAAGASSRRQERGKHAPAPVAPHTGQVY